MRLSARHVMGGMAAEIPVNFFAWTRGCWTRLVKIGRCCRGKGSGLEVSGLPVWPLLLAFDRAIAEPPAPCVAFARAKSVPDVAHAAPPAMVKNAPPTAPSPPQTWLRRCSAAREPLGQRSRRWGPTDGETSPHERVHAQLATHHCALLSPPHLVAQRRRRQLLLHGASALLAVAIAAAVRVRAAF